MDGRDVQERGLAVVDERVARAVLGLMRWANRTDVRREVWVAKEVTLSPPDLSLLIAIADQGPVRATDLAGTLGLDKSTVSPQVRRLERLGLVSRAIAESDRRASLLTLTDVGSDTVARLEQTASRLLGARLAHWTPADRETLTTLLERLVSDLGNGQKGNA